MRQAEQYNRNRAEESPSAKQEHLLSHTLMSVSANSRGIL
jgi:hypothetical protein